MIDEGQDFSPEMIRSLALAIPEGGSLTMFADITQQIYGRRISGADAGLKIGEPCRFEKNYRNSPQIAKLGLSDRGYALLRRRTRHGRADEVRGRRAMPTLVRFDSAGEETAFVIDQARRAAESGSVAVLVRRRRDEGFLRRAFSGAQRLPS